MIKVRSIHAQRDGTLGLKAEQRFASSLQIFSLTLDQFDCMPRNIGLLFRRRVSRVGGKDTVTLPVRLLNERSADVALGGKNGSEGSLV